ncbi:hypothetical protein [Streptomyces sp. NBC_00986]|uniref:hypothetical protein n=1 Tax=Streptomyces sp. NBC_00986 TaxID=2903702 RepID=UPI0038669215|nr:hypothetical protein OG504_51235 [Streptomyces sp. NBC_00986]
MVVDLPAHLRAWVGVTTLLEHQVERLDQSGDVDARIQQPLRLDAVGHGEQQPRLGLRIDVLADLLVLPALLQAFLDPRAQVRVSPLEENVGGMGRIRGGGRHGHEQAHAAGPDADRRPPVPAGSAVVVGGGFALFAGARSDLAELVVGGCVRS